MTYQERFETALMLELEGLTENNIIDIRNALFMKDYELLNSHLSYLCELIENLGYNINQLDLKLLEKIATEFNL